MSGNIKPFFLPGKLPWHENVWFPEVVPEEGAVSRGFRVHNKYTRHLFKTIPIQIDDYNFYFNRKSFTKWLRRNRDYIVEGSPIAKVLAPAIEKVEQQRNSHLVADLPPKEEIKEEFPPPPIENTSHLEPVKPRKPPTGGIKVFFE